MAKICMNMIALLLCSVIKSISAIDDIDKSPTAVQNWFEENIHKEEKISKFHFFLHEVSGGNKQTIFPVAQPPISFTSPTLFGKLNMIDDILREGPELDSQIIGRAQGLTGLSSLEDFSLIMTVNFVFTRGKFNGSTLGVHGHNPLSNQYSEMPIVGGSGVFRLAKGIVTAEAAQVNATSGVAIAKYDVIVLHY